MGLINLSDILSDPAAFGAVLQAMRLDVGLTQQELAGRLRDRDVRSMARHWTGVAMVEAGSYAVDLETLHHWCAVCGGRAGLSIEPVEDCGEVVS